MHRRIRPYSPCNAQAPACLSQDAGYTLIQLAIAMIVIGVLLTPLIASYNLYTKEQRTVKTAERIQGAIAALQNFRDMNGFYPCPAPMKMGRNAPPIGVERYGAATACRTNPAITALAAGQCDTTLGICVEEAIPARKAALAALVPPVTSRVIVGTVPFRTMQLDEEDAFDSYGSRLVYAITENMTNDQMIDETIGAIAIRKASGTDLLTPSGSAAFFVSSPGPTKMGAYSIEGNLVRACNDTAVAEADEENCNVGFETGAATSPQSVYVSDVASDAQGAAFFDDATGYFSNLFNPMWRRIASDQETIEDLSPKDVGMGTSTNPTVRLDIAPVGTDTQTLWARSPGAGITSALHTDSVCDTSGGNCFNINSLGGDPGDPTDPSDGTGGMECADPGEYIKGISNGTAICGPIEVRCPPGTPVLQSIGAGGSLNCVTTPQPGCPATTFTACTANDVVLGAVSNGVSVTRPGLTNPAAGGCRSVTYQCNAGSWTLIADTGAAKCSFTPTVTTSGNYACSAGRGPGPWWWTGTSVCTGGTSWTHNQSTQCLCTNTTVTETSNCQAQKGANYNPAQILTRIRTYTAACTNSAPPYDTSSCTCVVPNPSTRNSPVSGCPAYHAGSIYQPQVFNSSTCAWENSGPQVNGCTCNLTPIALPSTNPTCDATCEHIASVSTFEQAIDPLTCTPTGPITQTNVGACAANSFSWQYADASIGSATSYDVQMGESCTCAQHESSAKKICRQSNGALARCLCN